MQGNQTVRHWSLRGLVSLMACFALWATVVPATTAAAQDSSSREGVVNINAASSEELQRLPGVGPATAERIMAVRERRDGFDRTRQIVHVRGIGHVTYDKLRPMLTLEGRTTLSE